MSVKAGQRTNQEWLADLKSDEPSLQSSAHRDLRDLIRRGLAKSLAGRAGVDDATLDDFVQETAIRVLGKLETFRGDSQFRTWVLSIALRVAFSELRRHRWKDVSLDQLDAPELESGSAGTSSATSPEGVTHRGQIVEILYRAIDQQLTQRQRAVLLAELQGVPQIVIEERLGTNRNALYKLVHDARKRLRKALAEAGLSAAEIAQAYATEAMG